MFIILPHNYFYVFIFLFALYIKWNGCLNYNKVLFHCNFHFHDVVIATDATPTHCAFHFQGSGLPLSVSGAWSGSLSRAHIALQELQAVDIMLCRMAFHLSGNVVALHLDNSTAKAYLCNQGGTVSPFLSRLACQILSLTDKHDCFWSGTFSLRWLWHLFTFGAFLRWTSWHLLVLLNVCIIFIRKLHCLWGPWG